LSIKSFPYILLLGFLFGSTLIASRFSVGQYHPTNYVSLRFLLAASGYVLLYSLSRRHSWPRDGWLWRQGILLGILGTALPMTLIVSGLQYVSSGLGAVLLTVGPAITVIMAHFALPDEKLTPGKLIGVSLAFAGTALLALLGENGLSEVSGGNIGYVMILSSMFLGSAGAIYVRRNLRQANTVQLASIRMFSAAGATLIFTTVAIGFDLSQVNTQGYMALGYASLAGTFSGLLMVVYITQRFGATASAMTAYIIPIVAATGGALILDETITTGMLGGMALIVAGIAIINSRGRPRRPTQVHVSGD
jgi:drug/metabolite transporter (DMT)-like permease